ADRNRSHWSTSKTPSYTKSVSWQHHHQMMSSLYLSIIVSNVLCSAALS
ncbi:transposase, partial [Escherichia coli]